MNKLIYLINQRPVQPLTFGHQYDHNDLVIEFQGFKKLRKDSTLYLKIDGNIKALVPLSDSNQMIVQNYITKEAAASIPCQLVEYKLKESTAVAYELISNSDIFFGTVLPSLDESEIPEVTDPSLDLIYTQMHEMYLTIKNAYESGEFKGDTPIKGTDYWTDADKQEIVDDTVEAVQPTLNEKADKSHTHASSDIQTYEGNDSYMLDEWIDVTDSDNAFMYTCSDAFINQLQDYGKSFSYTAGNLVIFYADESDVWTGRIYKALKDVPANTEKTYLDNTINPPGVANGYWELYSLQDDLNAQTAQLEDINKEISIVNSSLLKNDNIPDDYTIASSYPQGKIVTCDGISYISLEQVEPHDYNTELPSPGVEKGFWKPLLTISDIYPTSYMVNEWKANSYNVGALVKYNGSVYKCIKQAYSINTTTPDNDTEHWESYEGTNYGDEVLASIEAKADKEHTHDFDEIQDKTRTLSVWADNVDNTFEDIEESLLSIWPTLFDSSGVFLYDKSEAYTKNSCVYIVNDGMYLALKDIPGGTEETYLPDAGVTNGYWKKYSLLQLWLNTYTKSETYSQEEINDLISKIPKFAIEVVDALPTSDISETTVYLLKTSETETDNLYTEYIYIGGKWEMLGTQKLDLSNYYKSAEVDKLAETEKTARQNADSELETKISDEATARQNADSALETKIADEAKTAREAESKNTEAITSEASRAEAAEKTLQSNIDTEATVRQNADSALETKIADTGSKKVGYQEVQGNTLYMYTDDTKAVLLATLELPAAPVQDVQINGSSILTDGVANVPIASDSEPGVIGLSDNYGVSKTNANNIFAFSRTNTEYNSMSNNAFISKGTLTNIQKSYVDGILCSTDETKALTTEQQIAARERIGANTKSGWTKVATITDPNGGDILNLEGYDEIYLYGNLATSAATWIYFITSGGRRASQIHSSVTGTDVSRTLFIHIFNTPLGCDTYCKYYGELNYSAAGTMATAYALFNHTSVADVVKIGFQYPDYVTTLSLDVYAK